MFVFEWNFFIADKVLDWYELTGRAEAEERDQSPTFWYLQGEGRGERGPRRRYYDSDSDDVDKLGVWNVPKLPRRIHVGLKIFTVGAGYGAAGWLRWRKSKAGSSCHRWRSRRSCGATRHGLRRRRVCGKRGKTSPSKWASTIPPLFLKPSF